MPFSTVVTPDDLKKGDLVEPGNYACEFSAYEEKIAEKDKSINCVLRFKVFEGPDAVKGKEFIKYLNEKGFGYEKELLAALFGPPDPAVGYRLSTELFQSKIGTKLKVFVKRGKNDAGKEFNECAGYMPLTF